MTIHHFIDRRQNPKDKSLGNRQRFMKRARGQLKEVVNKSIKERNITDAATSEKISIPTKGINEPRLRQSGTGGERNRVFPGNKEFETGDRIPKPQSGRGGGGKKASDSGEGVDQFEFVLSRDEFLDLFFEDLALPDLVKTSLKEIHATKPRRAGYTATGTPTNLNVLRTMRAAYGRRIALRRPAAEELHDIQQQILKLESKSDPTPEDRQKLKELHALYEQLSSRRRAVPYIDPLDIRYNNFQPVPQPNTKAVMFCLMDVSGSMGEREKDLAKRFFILLHLFLKRRYERIEVVFVRHTHEAEEVDEETFFYSRETGGTKVSTALVEMKRIVSERYSPAEWNIYAAQASDGDNFTGDGERCLSLLNDDLMPLCQYYAYVEILDERESLIFKNSADGTALWRNYQAVSQEWDNFAMKRIAQPGDIYPVFRELFAADASER